MTFRLIVGDDAMEAIVRAIDATKRRARMRVGYRKGDAPIVLRDGPFPEGCNSTCFPHCVAANPKRIEHHPARYIPNA